jgi:hypothetical protein
VERRVIDVLLARLHDPRRTNVPRRWLAAALDLPLTVVEAAIVGLADLGVVVCHDSDEGQWVYLAPWVGFAAFEIDPAELDVLRLEAPAFGKRVARSRREVVAFVRAWLARETGRPTCEVVE